VAIHSFLISQTNLLLPFCPGDTIDLIDTQLLACSFINLGEAAWFAGFPPSRFHRLAFFSAVRSAVTSGESLLSEQGLPGTQTQPKNPCKSVLIRG